MKLTKTMTDKKIKILLVEDDAMILDMYKGRLEEEGYEVFTTDKGSSAIELAKKEKPEIILLDVILPEVDGFTILDEIKQDKLLKNTPVMMLTNLGQETDQNKAIARGAVGYFVKAQHTPGDIIKKVKELIK